MIISREAAIEALRRLISAEFTDFEVGETMKGFMRNSYELAKALEEHWIDCPHKRPVDNHVIAMRHAWVAGNRGSHAWDAKVLEGEYDETIIKAVEIYHAKLAELEGGK